MICIPYNGIYIGLLVCVGIPDIEGCSYI